MAGQEADPANGLICLLINLVMAGSSPRVVASESGTAALDELRVEARSVGGLEVGKVRGVVDTAGHIRKVDTFICVHAVGVATEPEAVGVGGVLDCKIAKESLAVVWS